MTQLDLEKGRSSTSLGAKVPWAPKDDAEVEVDHEGAEENPIDEELLEDAAGNGEGSSQKPGNNGWQAANSRADQGTGMQMQSQWRNSHQAQRRRSTPYGGITKATPATRPRPCKPTDSESNDAPPPPRSRRKCEDNGGVVQMPWPTAAQASSLADQERAAMQAQLDAKDAQIAGLQASLVKLQATLDTMMMALQASGAIGAGAALSLEEQAAAQVTQQQLSAQQQQQPSPPLPSPAPMEGVQGVQPRENWHDATEQEQLANEPNL